MLDDLLDDEDDLKPVNKTAQPECNLPKNLFNDNETFFGNEPQPE